VHQDDKMLNFFSEKMGILDDVLRPHLQAATELYNSRNNAIMNVYLDEALQEASISDENKSVDLASVAIMDQIKRRNAAEGFREQGNALFKAHEFPQALRMYTQSIAAALRGPLASLAYSNRYSIQIYCLLNSHIKRSSLHASDLRLCFK
jgi:hypothetical protein